MKVKSMNEAWSKANEIFPTDYERDSKSSERAGYPIYRSTAEGHYYDYICDLGDRLEVNLSNGETINIWVEDEPVDTVEETKDESYFKVAVKAMKSGEIKEFTVDDFIDKVRFFWNSGEQSAFEKKLNAMCAALKAADNHGDAMETIYSGLIIKVIYYRWQNYDRYMNFNEIQ